MFLFLSGDSLHVAPVERSYKAKTLAHYPENVSWNPFDEHAVCMVSEKIHVRCYKNVYICNPWNHITLVVCNASAYACQLRLAPVFIVCSMQCPFFLPPFFLCMLIVTMSFLVIATKWAAIQA